MTRDRYAARQDFTLLGRKRVDHRRITPVWHDIRKSQNHSLCVCLVVHSLGALYLIAVFTGRRRGELAALQWDNIDLDAERPFSRPVPRDREPKGGRRRRKDREVYRNRRG